MDELSFYWKDGTDLLRNDGDIKIGIEVKMRYDLSRKWLRIKRCLSY
jgi:hypothetical protein